MENNFEGQSIADKYLSESLYSEDVIEFATYCKVSFNEYGMNEDNTFHRFVYMEIDEDIFSLVRMHGMIGMPGFANTTTNTFYFKNDCDFEELDKDENAHDFHRLNLSFFNARHLTFGQPESQQSGPIENILLYLLDEYMPTGILHIDQVNAAEEVLNEIKEKLDYPIDKNLSSSFYRIIPQVGGKGAVTPIDNIDKYVSKMRVLIRLRSALESLAMGVISSLNPIDYFARYWLRTSFDLVSPGIKKFMRLKTCVQRTQHPNDRTYDLTNIFKVNSEASENFTDDMANQCLLYHFTFPHNILGILREGLRVAPSHIHSTNRLHGRGIYFWDCTSMALRSFNTHKMRKAILLVCRVALGNMDENRNFFDQESLGEGKNSLFVQGGLFSQTRDKGEIIDGALFHAGEIGNMPEHLMGHVFDSYNKYMVPSKNQVKIEYILEFDRIN